MDMESKIWFFQIGKHKTEIVQKDWCLYMPTVWYLNFEKHLLVFMVTFDRITRDFIEETRPNCQCVWEDFPLSASCCSSSPQEDISMCSWSRRVIVHRFEFNIVPILKLVSHFYLVYLASHLVYLAVFKCFVSHMVCPQKALQYVFVTCSTPPVIWWGFSLEKWTTNRPIESPMELKLVRVDLCTPNPRKKQSAGNLVLGCFFWKDDPTFATVGMKSYPVMWRLFFLEIN